MSDYLLIFVTGLLTSLHCIGMCGPIVVAYSLQDPRQQSAHRRASLPLHVAFNGGRVVSYTLIGGLVGFAGKTLHAVQAVGEYVGIIGGVLMIIAGLAILGVLPIQKLLSFRAGASVSARVHVGLLRSRSTRSKLLLGLLTPLIPCGILYAMFLKAATTGGVVSGAITMALFGVGMTPSLMLIGSFSSLASSRVRKRAEQMAAAIIVVMGVSLLLRGLHVPYLRWLWAPMHGHHVH